MKKALIIQNKFIGDVLVASILAKNIKKSLPETEVHFLCYNKAVGILENNPYIDKILSFNEADLKKISTLWEYSQKIKAEKYDILLDPYAKLQSRFITLFSKAKQRISFDKPFFKYIYTDVFLEEKFPKIIQCTSIENRCILLSPFIKDFSKIDFQTEIFLSEKEINTAKITMRNAGILFDKPILMIGVLGSSLSKSWPLNYMAELINNILEKYDVDVLFNYVSSQQKEVDIILKNIKYNEKIFTNVLGNNIREFSAILKNSHALIANEGGAVNIAKALSKPTFSIFSPHKFRKDWGCYENLFIHRSFHLTDIFPEIYTQYSIKEILKNPQPFYSLLYSDKVIPKVNKFIQEVLQIPEKQNSNYNLKDLRPKITALCITYNEELNMERYFKDISFADEIIVVDSFSTDKTKEICEKYSNVKFIQRKFDNFTNQRNFAIDQAENEWIMFFDLDEHIPQALRTEILMTVNSPEAKDAYWVYRKFYFLGKYIKYSGWKNDKAIRLFKKSKSRYTESKLVHETIDCETKPEYLKNKVDHFSFISLDSYQKKLDLYAEFKAKEFYLKGTKPNFFHKYFKPTYRFFHHYIIQLGFLDGKEGYIISKLYAEYVANQYKYLENLQKNKN